MIASVRGTLVMREPDGVVIETSGGTGYLISVPLGVFERLPPAGQTVHLHTELVVREDEWLLFGFDSPAERVVFRRLLAASGVGPRLALAILSTLGPDRTVRSIRDRDLAALASVAGIGRKKAERIALELADRFDDLPTTAPRERGGGAPAAEAVRALVGLGYTATAAETAVRTALDEGPTQDAATLIRRALPQLARK
jgi:holliday junction DNA helicase RuvA